MLVFIVELEVKGYFKFFDERLWRSNFFLNFVVSFGFV